MQNKIYILHDYGDQRHYCALHKLAEDNGIKLAFYEFSCIRHFIKSIKKKNFKLLKKQIMNCLFIFGLIFSKNKKILLGIAPFDYRIIFLRLFLFRHKVYYHTSWPYWNEIDFPKKIFVNSITLYIWKNFLKQSEYIFSVTLRGKTNLQKYLKISNIDVVYHSYDKTVFFNKNLIRDIDYLYVGRLVCQKGIKELLEVFSKRKEKLVIVGDGELKDFVVSYANKFKNIEYLGKKDKYELASIYNRSKFFILNSKRTDKWEELFGIVLVEAMACGCIPIAVNHIGPSEIIENNISGILFEEGKLEEILGSKIHFFIKEKNVLQRAKMFERDIIKKHWKSIL